MPLTIPDDLLEATGLSEDEARIEIACRLFAAEVIAKGDATRWTGMSRPEFKNALIDRGLPWIIYTEEALEQDLRTLRKDPEFQAWHDANLSRSERHLADCCAESSEPTLVAADNV